VRIVAVAVVAYLVARLHVRRRSAAVDPKTGVLTPAAWERAAARALRRRGVAGVALLMLDIDGFKQVNDSRGHLAGDAVLASVGRALRASIRQDDPAGRFGGDEFSALLVGITRDQALAAAGRVRDAVATTCSVTVSIGVAWSAPSTPTAVRALVERADAALYRAKQDGGNTGREPVPA
jgi:diguanylate cyclase (GGDEF)-like protein